MAIQELIAVVPPPAEPIDRGAVELWPKVLDEIGFRLPDDLRDFGIHYGSGRFCGSFLEVFNPFSEHFLTRLQEHCEPLLAAKDYDPEAIPYPIFPEVPGLLPWGTDENGNNMSWLTEGEPNDWPIILVNDCNEHGRWDLPLTTFLAKAFSNEIKCHLWHPWEPAQRTFHRGRSQGEVWAEINRTMADRE